MKTVGATDYTNETHPKAFQMENNVQVQHPSKIRKYLSNVHKKEGAHLQCENNHYAKFENKAMKTVGVTNYTNQTPSKHSWTEKCLRFTPIKITQTRNHLSILDGKMSKFNNCQT